MGNDALITTVLGVLRWALIGRALVSNMLGDSVVAWTTVFLATHAALLSRVFWGDGLFQNILGRSLLQSSLLSTTR